MSVSAKETKDFLIRGMPRDLYLRLEKSAKEHHRSKTQEAIVTLYQGLAPVVPALEVPTPLSWKKKYSSKEIKKAIQERRE